MKYACILSILFAVNVCAQNKTTSQLLQQLAIAKEDTAKVNLLYTLSTLYRFSRPDSTMLLAKEGLALAQKLNFKQGEISCLNSIADAFTVTGNYPKALETYLQTLKLDESVDDKKNIANDLDNIGNLYTNLKDYKQALTYMMKAKSIYENYGDKYNVVIDLLNIGNNYEKLNMLDSARIYTHTCYDKSLAEHFDDVTGAALTNLANIHSKMKENTLAMDYYRLALIYLNKSGFADGVCEASLGMAELFKQAGNSDSAIHYSKQSLAIAQQSGFMERIFNAANFLTDYYESINKIDSAFAYQRMSIIAKDSLYGAEKIQAVQNLTFTEEQRQQELAEQRLEVQREHKKNLQMAGIAFFIPNFFLFVLFLRRRKVNQKTVEFLGVLALLLLFEFITLATHSVIQERIRETPVIMLIISIVLASIIAPWHHRLEKWMKERLVYAPLPKNKTAIAKESVKEITSSQTDAPMQTE